MRRPTIAAMILIALTGAACPKGNDMKAEVKSTDLPPPRDGNIAVREELEAARRAGTAAAYDLFLARHGDHPLAGVAREERRRLARNPVTPTSR